MDTLDLRNKAEDFINEQLFKRDVIKQYLDILPNLYYNCKDFDDTRTAEQILLDVIFNGENGKAKPKERFYSRNNTILIFIDYPNAKSVNNYDYWKNNNCPVLLGEHGVQLVQPEYKYVIDKQTKKPVAQICGYKVYTAHEYSETSETILLVDKKKYSCYFGMFKAGMENLYSPVVVEYTDKISKFKFNKNKNVASISSSLEGERLLRVLCEGIIKLKKPIINAERKRLGGFSLEQDQLENKLVLYAITNAYGMATSHMQDVFKDVELWSADKSLDEKKIFLNIVYYFVTEICLGINKAFM